MEVKIAARVKAARIQEQESADKAAKLFYLTVNILLMYFAMYE